MKEKTRCGWCLHDPLDIKYHDEEWGKPCHDDRMLFEMINLEGAQAGLSWFTILQKRDNYKKLFANFDAKKLAKFSDEQLQDILTNPGIIRNKLKVFGVRKNAIAFLKVQEEFGSFSKYLWSWVDGTPIVNQWKGYKDAPAQTELSQKLSKDLKKRGFTFVGPTICYAYMQAIGMVNDHTVDCFRYSEV